MKTPRVFKLLLLAISVLFTTSVYAADTYPVKPVRFLVGFSPGGANDLVARVVAAKLSPLLGQQVVVDNRAGAGGNTISRTTCWRKHRLTDTPWCWHPCLLWR